LSRIQEALLRTKKPNGKKHNPGVTCKDILLQNPDSEDGWYYIDPNGGTFIDAVEVYCRMKLDGETCIPASPKTFEEQRWTKDTRAQWFGGDILGSSEFSYKIEAIQLKMLQMHSSSATQRITYKCLNSDPKGAVLLSSDFDKLETADKKQDRSSSARVDTFGDCKKNNQWGEMVFDIKSARSEVLPILDIKLKDVGLENQEFSLSIGEVCFNT